MRRIPNVPTNIFVGSEMLLEVPTYASVLLVWRQTSRVMASDPPERQATDAFTTDVSTMRTISLRKRSHFGSRQFRQGERCCCVLLAGSLRSGRSG
ncbi:hypothetical protein BN77_p10827 [Rhizobium mesoamericanum STM3625]|uniref:Uncharacterized protein n=1 Tax=Rhizobium mesoamericanum STM3625 TaxID=1211777 RepID=K0Q3R2_9HYPH|nr:hypothetical protein BN77_p10827 [Rhizobium mesoamericanum STM3625]